MSAFLNEQAPWMTADLFPLTAPGVYGYMEGGVSQACSEPELLERVCADTACKISLVWTPEHPRMSLPEETPWLVRAALVRRRVYERLQRLGIGAYLITVLALGSLLPVNTVLMIVAIQVLMQIAGRMSITMPGIDLMTGSDQAITRRVVAGLRFSYWLDRRQPYWTYGLIGLFTVVALAQIIGASDVIFGIGAAGVVREAVLRGEWWRFGTAALLQPSFLGAFVHITLVLASGRLIEHLISPLAIPVLFIAGVIGGALLVIPLGDDLSAGPSSGLVGLVGGLLALYRMRRADMEGVSDGGIRIAIPMIAILMLFDDRYIDLAGILGGLFAGYGAGRILLLGSAAIAPVRLSRAVRGVGWAAWGMLGVLAAVTIWLLLR